MVEQGAHDPHLLQALHRPHRRHDRGEDLSNQPSVTLYANGQELETKTGEKVFAFRVPLDSELRLLADAGSCTDKAVFRKVSQPNPSYTLQKGNSTSANWV